MTPLHQAVITGDLDAVSQFKTKEDWLLAPDPLGFTPLELAKLLGRHECMVLLGTHLPDQFLLQKKDEAAPQPISRAVFQEFFQITYRPYLHFPSYDALKWAVKSCPYLLRSPSLATDNYNWTKTYFTSLWSGETAPIDVKWIDDAIGYGAFAMTDIAACDYVGEYTGVVRRLLRRHADPNGYCFHYPTRFWSFQYATVDSIQQGNLIRFVNHSNRPNLIPLCLVDRRILHLVLVAVRDIKQGEELVFDYGPDYWRRRKKSLR